MGSIRSFNIPTLMVGNRPWMLRDLKMRINENCGSRSMPDSWKLNLANAGNETKTTMKTKKVQNAKN